MKKFLTFVWVFLLLIGCTRGVISNTVIDKYENTFGYHLVVKECTIKEHRLQPCTTEIYSVTEKTYAKIS